MVKKLINRAKNNHLVKSSAIFFIGSMVASFASYLFQLSMGRMLTVEGYGELQSLLSIFMIIFIPSAALSMIVTKYSSEHVVDQDFTKIKGLLRMLTKNFIYLGLGVFLLLIIFSGNIASYLQINETSKVIIISSVFVFVFLSAINRGLLQGMQYFKALSLLGIFEALVKLFFGLFLVWIGWNVYGAVSAIVFGAVFGYVYSIFPIRRILKKTTTTIVFEKKELRDLIKYSLPVFLSLLGVTVFLSLDIILAKHYFSPEIAGAYGGIAIISRIIFFANTPFISVLFSVVSKQHNSSEDYYRSFFLSLMIILLISFSAISLYFIAPKFVIQMLLGAKYFFISPYLGWYALSVTLLCLINLVVNFLLAIKQTKCVYWVLIGVVGEYISITLWHNSIAQMIFVINSVMFTVLVGLMFFYLKSYRNNRALLAKQNV